MDSKDQIKVLLIEDDEDDYILAREYLTEIKTVSYHLDWVASYSAGLESIEKAQYDVYLVDYRLGERDGLDLLREAISRGCNAPIIILTGQGDHEVDVAAMSAGAADYLVKGQINTQILERTIRYAIERKKAEQALSQSEEKYRTLISEISDGIYISDREGVLTFANGALARALGFEQPEDIIGKYFTDFVAPEMIPAIAQRYITAMEEGISVGELEVEIVRGDGERAYLEIRPTSIIEDGKIAGSRGVIRDITDRKQARDALQESEQRYHSLFDRIPIGLYKTTSSGQILDANPALVDMLGYRDLDSLRSINMEDTYQDPENRERLLAKLEQEGIVRDYRVQLNRPDGQSIWVEINARLGSDNIESQIIEGSIININQRQRLEIALQRRDAILGAISFASGEILRSADWHKGVRDALRGLGEGAEVCRAYIFENRTDLKNVLLTSQRYEWAAPGITPLIDSPDLQNFPLVAGGFTRWVETLSQGDVIQGHVRQFPESEREILAAQGIQSILIMPIFIGDSWWGFIGYDACVAEREWEPMVVDALKTAADTLGAAIQRSRAEEHIQTQLQRLDGLRQIDQAITGSMELKITLNVVIEQVTEQLRVDAADILLYQPFIQTLEYAAGRGFRTAALQHTNLRIGEGFAGRAALERRTIHIPDLFQSENGFTRSPQLKNEEFVSYFGVPLIAKGDIKGVLEIFHRQKLDPDSEWLNYLETLAGQAAIAIDNATLFRNLQDSNLEIFLAYDSTLEGWAKALELRDQETEGHSRRVVELTLKIARAMGMREDELVHARRGALLHDIGKMGVPDQILQKPGPLDEKEWEIMRQHPVYAYQWLSPIRYLNKALEIPYAHHEKWDGSGYPRGLKGTQIPLAARIFAIVDVWDALNSDRPYRDAWQEEKILAYLQEQSGKHFDPHVVVAFLDLLAEKSSG